jgi:CheY-like chemotaxis protein
VLRERRERPSGSSEATPTLQSAPTGDTRVRSFKILFVEDDELIRIATADLLESLGHAVFEAADADKALSILEGTEVDILMTDIGLPGMSGSVLAAEARRANPELKVIFATGAGGASVGNGDDATHGAFLLRKPYDADALNAVLRAAGSS